MDITSVGYSDVGRVRYNNEDSYFVEGDIGVFAVADGVGGSRAGETASRLFCDVLREHTEAFRTALNKPGTDPERRSYLLGLVERVFQRASERIYRMAERKAEYRGMATTGVVLAIGQAGAVLGHVGDSRAYLLRGETVQQLTVDHTLAQEMLNQGLITEEELPTFPHRNVLARAVGQLPTVRVDTAWLDVTGGDTLLLCSDGLHDKLTDAEIRDIVRAKGLKAAIDAANDRGGEDNITGITVSVAPDAAGDAVLDTQTKMLCIQNIFLFRYLTEQELVRVLKVVYEAHFERGKPVFSEGSPGDAMYIVFSGSVDVRKGTHHLTTIGPGGHFGELAFMDGHPRSATVVSTQPTTLLTIKRDDFRTLTRTDPVIASKLLWCFVLNMAGRLRDLSSSYVRAKES